MRIKRRWCGVTRYGEHCRIFAISIQPRKTKPTGEHIFWRIAWFSALSLTAGLLALFAYGNGWIEQLYVLPDVQGAGIGTRLLSLAMNDMDDIRVWTFQQNRRARAFYKSRGFSPVEETDGSGNEENEPDVLYHWRRLPEPVYSADARHR